MSCLVWRMVINQNPLHLTDFLSLSIHLNISLMESARNFLWQCCWRILKLLLTSEIYTLREIRRKPPFKWNLSFPSVVAECRDFFNHDTIIILMQSQEENKMRSIILDISSDIHMSVIYFKKHGDALSFLCFLFITIILTFFMYYLELGKLKIYFIL